jgi:hypothetical protein
MLAWPSHNADLANVPGRRERVHRTGMPQNVRRNPFAKDRRLLRCRGLDVRGQSERKSVAGHGLPIGIEEYLGSLRVGPYRKPRTQYELGLFPERKDPFTPTLAHDVHGGQGAVREIAKLQRYEFRHPQPASISQMQHRAIAGAKPCAGVRGIKQGLDLGPVEIVDQRLVSLLGRD